MVQLPLLEKGQARALLAERDSPVGVKVLDAAAGTEGSGRCSVTVLAASGVALAGG